MIIVVGISPTEFYIKLLVQKINMGNKLEPSHKSGLARFSHRAKKMETREGKNGI
jgi:hypothetical protein